MRLRLKGLEYSHNRALHWFGEITEVYAPWLDVERLMKLRKQNLIHKRLTHIWCT